MNLNRGRALLKSACVFLLGVFLLGHFCGLLGRFCGFLRIVAGYGFWSLSFHPNP